MAISLYNDSDIISFKCGATVTANRLVKLDSTADTVIHSTAEGDASIGVATVGGATGEWIPVQVGVGKAKITASAAITLNAQVEAAAAGKCAAAAGAASHSVGYALEAAAADGDIITVLIKLPVLNGPPNA